jgi:hypothetical protein
LRTPSGTQRLGQPNLREFSLSHRNLRADFDNPPAWNLKEIGGAKSCLGAVTKS